jgi:peptidyl-dipeptidase Dcp
MSILTEKFKTKHNSAPFTSINIEEYYPAFVQNIEKARIEIDEIIHATALATFKNTIEALEYSGEALDRLSSIFFNLNSAETSETGRCSGRNWDEVC